MIYVMSDIHGCYDKYLKMLEKICLKEEDTLYILGDVVDRGPDGIKILLDMMSHKNIVPIIGNHEFMAYKVLKKLMAEITEENYDNAIGNDDMENMLVWMSNGGATTQTGFSELNYYERKRVINYISNFSAYEELSVGEKDYILVHAGLNNFSPEKELADYDIYDLIWERADYEKKYFEDKILVTGHTPTGLIDPEYRGKIYKKNNHIAIDCGAVYIGVLGCICLDTLEEFYV